LRIFPSPSTTLLTNSVRKLLSALALAVVLTGLSQAASVAKKPVPPTSRIIPDAQTERTIRAKFAKSKINVEHFTVTVQNGLATIEGKTNVIQHKGVATRLAKSGGALAVRNNIQISEAAKEKAAAKLAQIRSGDTQVARAGVVQPAKPK
jgi:hypothetical protein